MNLSQLRNRIVYILKNESQQSIYLVLANNSHSKDGTPYNMQVKSSTRYPKRKCILSSP